MEGKLKFVSGAVTFKLSDFLGSTEKLIEALEEREELKDERNSLRIRANSCAIKLKRWVSEKEQEYDWSYYTDFIFELYPVPPNPEKQEQHRRTKNELLKHWETNKKRREAYQRKKEAEKKEREEVLAALGEKLKSTLFE